MGYVSPHHLFTSILLTVRSDGWHFQLQLFWYSAIFLMLLKALWKCKIHFHTSPLSAVLEWIPLWEHIIDLEICLCLCAVIDHHIVIKCSLLFWFRFAFVCLSIVALCHGESMMTVFEACKSVTSHMNSDVLSTNVAWLCIDLSVFNLGPHTEGTHFHLKHKNEQLDFCVHPEKASYRQ